VICKKSAGHNSVRVGRWRHGYSDFKFYKHTVPQIRAARSRRSANRARSQSRTSCWRCGGPWSSRWCLAASSLRLV